MNKWILGVTLVWRLSVWYSTKIDNLQLQKWRLSRQVIESAIQPIQNIKEKHFLRYCIVNFLYCIVNFFTLLKTASEISSIVIDSSLIVDLLNQQCWWASICLTRSFGLEFCIQLNRIDACGNNLLATDLSRQEIKKSDLILLKSFRECKLPQCCLASCFSRFCFAENSWSRSMTS